MSDVTTVDELFDRLDTDADDWSANPTHIAGHAPTITFVDRRIMAPNYDSDMTAEHFCNFHLLKFYAQHRIQMTEPSDAYFRWSTNETEIEWARDGTIRPSKNHLKDPPQSIGGLSVSSGPWLYFRLHPFCYLVSGADIGPGSDDEPVIDIPTLRVRTSLRRRRQVFDDFYRRNRKVIDHLSVSNGISEVELVGLLLGTCV